MIEKYRVHEVAKDLNIPSKDIIALLEEHFPGEPASPPSGTGRAFPSIYPPQPISSSNRWYTSSGIWQARERSRRLALRALRKHSTFWQR